MRTPPWLVATTKIGEQFTGVAGNAFDNFDFPHFQQQIAQARVGAGPGVEGANLPFDLDGGTGPVDAAISLRDFPGVRGARLVLVRARALPSAINPTVSTSKSAPSFARRSCNVALVSSA